MNKLAVAKLTQILTILFEEWSMLLAGRAIRVSANRINKLLIDGGLACGAFHGVADLGSSKQVRSRRIST
jgi:hypothetical protein